MRARLHVALLPNFGYFFFNFLIFNATSRERETRVSSLVDAHGDPTTSPFVPFPLLIFLTLPLSSSSSRFLSLLYYYFSRVFRFYTSPVSLSAPINVSTRDTAFGEEFQSANKRKSNARKSSSSAPRVCPFCPPPPPPPPHSHLCIMYTHAFAPMYLYFLFLYDLLFTILYIYYYIYLFAEKCGTTTRHPEVRSKAETLFIFIIYIFFLYSFLLLLLLFFPISSRIMMIMMMCPRRRFVNCVGNIKERKRKALENSDCEKKKEKRNLSTICEPMRIYFCRQIVY